MSRSQLGELIGELDRFTLQLDRIERHLSEGLPRELAGYLSGRGYVTHVTLPGPEGLPNVNLQILDRVDGLQLVFEAYDGAVIHRHTLRYVPGPVRAVPETRLATNAASNTNRVA